MEETYESARGLNFHDFWRSTVSNSDVRELLCECSLERYQNGVGIIPAGLEDDSYEDDLRDMSEEKAEDDTLEETELMQSDNTLLDQSISLQTNSNSMSGEESGLSISQFPSPTRLHRSERMPLDVVDGTPPHADSMSSVTLHVQGKECLEEDLGKTSGAEEDCQSKIVGDSFQTTPSVQIPQPQDQEEESGEIELFRMSAPVGQHLRDGDESDDEFMEEILPPGAEGEVLWDLLDKDVTASNVDCEPCCPRCPCLRQPTIFETGMTEEEMDILAVEKNSETTEKIGQRIHQVASIIRNLSFDKVNAELMGHNSCILR